MEIEILPREIERRPTNGKLQVAFWIPAEEKHLYDELQNAGVRASHHCRVALSKVIKHLAEQEGLLKEEKGA